MDEADQTQVKMEVQDAMRLAEIRARGPEAQGCGACLWCDAPLQSPRRWCNADCRDAWQRTENRHARNSAR